MKKILILLFVTIQITAQPDFNLDQRIIQAGKFYNSEIHYFPSEKSYKVFYSYKISYSQLFFEKNDGEFKAALKVNLEIQDSLNKSVKRVFDQRKISTTNFELTNSENTFLQGLVSFDIEPGSYKVLAIISDGISKRERRIPPIELSLDQKNQFLNPIIIENGIFRNESNELFLLCNNSNSIPFNKTVSDLLFPVINPDYDSLIISVKQGESYLVAEKVLKDFIICNGKLDFAKEFIGIKKCPDSNGIKCFLFNDISSQLDEGPVQIEIKSDKTSEVKTFKLNVIWINKPMSLSDPEMAIKLLEIIEPKSVVSNILGAKGNDQTNLYEYWKSKDPTPNTKFNELMNEFYTRVDYSDKNFSGLTNNGGAKSDRGKTYIKLGAPDEIDRYTNSDDKVVETWNYKKMNKTFHFIDKDGTGKFQLAESK